MVKATEASTQSHNEATVDTCSGKHTVKSNVTKGIVVQSGAVSKKSPVQATI